MSIRKVLSAAAVIGILGVIAPVALAGTASAKPKHKTTTCTDTTAPTITKVGTVSKKNKSFQIKGTCLGTHTYPASGLSNYFEITDLSQKTDGQPWFACYNGAGLTCSITSWTDSKIKFNKITGPYYNKAGTNYSLHKGDRLRIEVWSGSLTATRKVTVK
jgi:hypothetical protein